MNKTYIFKSLKKNTEQRQKQIFTQNNDCYNTRDLKSVQLLVPYSDTSTTISISLTSFYSTCTNLILVWLLVLIKQILTWSEVWLAVSGTRVRMDLWCLISLFQMKRLKRQELKQNDTVFHCLLRNAQINTIIVQHIRTETIQSLTYVLTNSNKLLLSSTVHSLHWSWWTILQILEDHWAEYQIHFVCLLDAFTLTFSPRELSNKDTILDTKFKPSCIALKQENMFWFYEVHMH